MSHWSLLGGLLLFVALTLLTGAMLARESSNAVSGARPIDISATVDCPDHFQPSPTEEITAETISGAGTTAPGAQHPAEEPREPATKDLEPSSPEDSGDRDIPTREPLRARDRKEPLLVPAIDSESRDPALSGLLLPVQGVASDDLYDSYEDPRSAGRTHGAIDIMAPRGTPVLAAGDGTVAKLFESVRGGRTVYVYDTSGRYVHYYAHLASYAPGLAEGDEVLAGQILGRVGSSGNASADAPHLHFAIYRLAEGERWWQGTPVNPFPLFTEELSIDPEPNGELSEELTEVDHTRPSD